MATRPIFVPNFDFDERYPQLVYTVMVDFVWTAGRQPFHKKQNIAAIHAVGKQQGIEKLLEVSTKSDVRIGQNLSAFNLMVPTPLGDISVESAYQASKVFENGGPYHDIYVSSSLEAKQDTRLKTSGSIIGFNYFGKTWENTPATAFYDWLYLLALSNQPHEVLKQIYYYDGFTDIEFNPSRGINCQARTCAIWSALADRNLDEEVIQSPEIFLDIMRPHLQAEIR